jgi:hypothetical protein
MRLQVKNVVCECVYIVYLTSERVELYILLFVVKLFFDVVKKNDCFHKYFNVIVLHKCDNCQF